jgi:hypothetical protein
LNEGALRHPQEGDFIITHRKDDLLLVLQETFSSLEKFQKSFKKLLNMSYQIRNHLKGLMSYPLTSG